VSREKPETEIETTMSGSGFIPFGTLIDRIRNRDDDDFDGSYSAENLAVMDDDDGEGLYLVAATVVFLILLVVLRYGCIWFIDYVILCEHRRNRRKCLRGRLLLRSCCPRWFASPDASSSEDGSGDRDPEAPSGDNNDPPAADADDGDDDDNGTELVERTGHYTRRLVRNLAVDQRRRLFSSLIDHRTVTEADVRKVSESRGGCCAPAAGTASESSSSSSSSSTTAIPAVVDSKADNNNDPSSSISICCPICITEIGVGDRIYHCETCNSMFLFDCILEWLDTGSTLCPYCRGEMFTRAMLEEAYRKQQQQQGPRKEAA